MKLYQTFIEHYTSLKNFFTATGDVNLSNEMALHKIDQKVFVIKTLYSFGGSCIALERQYCQEFPFMLDHQETLSIGLLRVSRHR
jgi:hypothetical protein